MCVTLGLVQQREPIASPGTQTIKQQRVIPHRSKFEAMSTFQSKPTSKRSSLHQSKQYEPHNFTKKSKKDNCIQSLVELVQQQFFARCCYPRNMLCLLDASRRGREGASHRPAHAGEYRAAAPCENVRPNLCRVGPSPVLLARADLDEHCRRWLEHKTQEQRQQQVMERNSTMCHETVQLHNAILLNEKHSSVCILRVWVHRIFRARLYGQLLHIALHAISAISRALWRSTTDA